jgi:hypothetical protein
MIDALGSAIRTPKRFDAYAGIMFTGVHDGLANGYIHSTNMNPTIGVRYKFRVRRTS